MTELYVRAAAAVRRMEEGGDRPRAFYLCADDWQQLLVYGVAVRIAPTTAQARAIGAPAELPEAELLGLRARPTRGRGPSRLYGEHGVMRSLGRYGSEPRVDAAAERRAQARELRAQLRRR
ncbi:MAG: hypothetical protein RQ833_11675 [Sphingomonadaceae bacterium]|nr:hypothetical protein [Sphingomonadaceae bacterium]